MTSLAPALVLGTDSPIGLTVVRDLGAHGVPVHAIGKPRSIGRSSRFCSSFSERPAGPIADWLPDLIRTSGAHALFAVSEGDLIELAAMPARIGACQILTPRAEQLDIVLDKAATLARATALGITIPPSWQPSAPDAAFTSAHAISFPAVAKWRNPPEIWPLLEQAGLEFIKAEFLGDAAALHAMLERYQPLGRWPLVQSYCPGIGLGQMIFMDNGEAVLCFQHKRLREWPPEGGVSAACSAEPFERHEVQMERSIALLRSIDWQGPAMVEYRYDATSGSYWLMEINGRFWGSLPLAWQSGAHFAWEGYRRAILGQNDLAMPPRTDLNARFMVPDTRWLLRVLFDPAAIADPAFVLNRSQALGAYLGDFLKPKMRYFVLTRRDPLPLLSDVGSMMLKVLQHR